ncbi:MAG: hypothetical protein RL189_218 [Pseudomonadota bacterium]
MIRINLAPQVDQSVGRNSLALHAGIVIVLCFAAYFGIEYHSHSLDAQAQEIDDKIAELQNTKSSLNKEIERSKEIRAKTEQIRSRAARVRQLGEGRKIAILLLDSLQSKHPERMWFTKISYSMKNKSLVLNGYALDHTVIADYMKRLKEIGRIDATDASEMKDFIPPQLLNSDLKQSSVTVPVRSETQKLDQVTLKQLVSSEELQGDTLQKFEISIRITDG